MSLPKGTIAVVSGVLCRYPHFVKSLMAMERPPGTQLIWSVGAGIAQNRNEAIKGMAGEWIFFLDDDHTFPPTILIDLLKDKKDVVVPLVLRREPPHLPVTYDAYKPEAAPGSKDWGFRTKFLTDPPGLYQMKGAGTAGMLISRKVVDGLPKPLFEVGRFAPEELSEDLWFSKKVMEAGFEMWLDSRVTMSHLTPCAVWPVWKDGVWYTGYGMGTEGPMPLIRAAHAKEP